MTRSARKGVDKENPLKEQLAEPVYEQYFGSECSYHCLFVLDFCLLSLLAHSFTLLSCLSSQKLKQHTILRAQLCHYPFRSDQ
jgi:hypothetical protein